MKHASPPLADDAQRLHPIQVAESDASLSDLDDVLAIEEPLEIRVQPWDQAPVVVSVTMRSPGQDGDLALGFLMSEGAVRERSDVLDVRTREGDVGNITTVVLAKHVSFDVSRLSRHVFSHAGCGICGRLTLDELSARVPHDPVLQTPLPRHLPQRMAETLRQQQPLFAHTGGVHGAGLFNPSGELLVIREDVGRHNAVDKVVGARLLEGKLPAHETVLMLSGRVGFELVQKAVTAGIAVIAAVGAPTSLAVDLANRFGMTLIGFVKPDRYNIYCGESRLKA